jgi:DNA-binding MarR family transcriptional regulator
MLSRVTRSISVGLGRRLDDAGLTFAQYLVLVRLWRAAPAPLVQAELALELAVERSSVSTLLASLEDEGLVTRSPDPADGRRLLVQLTGRGRALELPVLGIVDEYEAELVHGFSPDQLEELARGLEKLQERALRLRVVSSADMGGAGPARR